MTLGMMEHTMGGERAVGHSGATMLFHARMVLLAGAEPGAVRRVQHGRRRHGGEPVHRNVCELLRVDSPPRRWRPRSSTVKLTEGYYLPNRRVHSTVAKVAALREGVLIDYDLDGQQLWLRTPNERVRFAAIDEDLFGEVGGHRRIAFQDDALYLSSVPHTGFERASRFERWGVNAMWLGISWAVLGSALILWPVSMVFGGRGAGVEGQWAGLVGRLRRDRVAARLVHRCGNQRRGHGRFRNGWVSSDRRLAVAGRCSRRPAALPSTTIAYRSWAVGLLVACSSCALQRCDGRCHARRVVALLLERATRLVARFVRVGG